MTTKDKIHDLLKECCQEVLAYVREREPLYPDGLVPATDVNEGSRYSTLALFQETLKILPGQKGWLFATFARMLEDDGSLEHRKKGTRSYYRVVRK